MLIRMRASTRSTRGSSAIEVIKLRSRTLSSMSTSPPPSLAKMLSRAARRRCPNCGGKGWFTGWFKHQERCRTCGYRFERQEGFMLGVMAINSIVTLGAILAAMIVGMALTWPDISVGPTVLACVIAAIVVPIVGYPFVSYIWAAVDLRMRPLEPAEEADALTWLATHRPGGTI
jgi:uncharacterized protein (DUF983 family)